MDGLIKIIKENLSISSIVLGVVLGVGTMLVLSDSFGGKSCVMDTETLSSPSTSEYVAVDLGGAVKAPGVYKLKQGSRIGDLLELGDGIISSASEKWVSKSLNLSQVLQDAEKIYIPFEWEVLDNDETEIATLVRTSTNVASTADPSQEEAQPSTSSEDSGDKDKISLNSGTNEELDSLPGIGSVYAQRIIDGRPYSSVQDFVDRAEIPDSSKDKILNLVSL